LLPDRLQKLLLKGEGESLDYKQTVHDPRKIARTIASFANTRGGVLLIGVKDNKQLTGIDPEEEKYVIEAAAEFFVSPPVFVEYEEIEVEEDSEIKTILVVAVPESKSKPHYVTNKQEESVVYIRQADRSIPAGKKMIKALEKDVISPDIEELDSIHLSFNEQQLITFLKKNNRITLKQFMKVINVSKRRATRILTDLTLSGIIRVHEHEKEDYYTL
jgi:predicted HTH transcriptional regulator